MAEYYKAPPLPRPFIWRKVQSLAGLWLVLFLIEHLLTNSQAALLIGDDGSGFVRAVNFIKDLPYLPVIEIVLLGVPFLLHGFWGIKYLWQAKYNSFPSDGSSPSLPQYKLNQAYTWQRLTSWILLFGIAAHVIHMRWIEYPTEAQLGTQQYYFVRLTQDNGLYTLSKRLGVDLFSASKIALLKEEAGHLSPLEAGNDTPQELIDAQSNREKKAWIGALSSRHLKEGQIMASAKTFGLAELLIVRNAFKSPLMIVLYTILVLAACFHAFNGLWTFMITWGVTLTAASQRGMRRIALFLMALISFLGLAAIWGTYWLNLMD
ncbi:MAG: succinate dehydrogenase cytochrome b558 subunit [Parachlamydia sp.]|nr:succinate dehydrogenase cytochrome b558 subunit [Parachlamydia sp.]